MSRARHKFASLSSHPQKSVISTEGGALRRRSGETCLSSAQAVKSAQLNLRRIEDPSLQRLVKTQKQVQP
jgi:hypothetical protein